jgi:fatty acid desaturase
VRACIRRRRRVAGAGWLYLIIFAAGGVTWAWIAALWLGVLITVLAALIVFLAVYGLLAAHAETDRRRRARRR